MRLVCPQCRREEFKALEQISAFVPCRFERTDNGGIEIEQEARGEFIREDANAIVISYTCAYCDFSFGAHQVEAALVEKT